MACVLDRPDIERESFTSSIDKIGSAGWKIYHYKARMNQRRAARNRMIRMLLERSSKSTDQNRASLYYSAG